MKTLTEKSKCDHKWVTADKQPTVCLWCGIPRVRKSDPVQRLKIPRASNPKFNRYG